jgi:hypothetical protein
MGRELVWPYLLYGVFRPEKISSIRCVRSPGDIGNPYYGHAERFLSFKSSIYKRSRLKCRGKNGEEGLSLDQTSLKVFILFEGALRTSGVDEPCFNSPTFFCDHHRRYDAREAIFSGGRYTRPVRCSHPRVSRWAYLSRRHSAQG